MPPSPWWSQLPGRRPDQPGAAPGLVGWRPPWVSTHIRPIRLVETLFVHIKVPSLSKYRPLSRLPPLSYEVPPSQSCAAPPLGAASSQVPPSEQESYQILARIDAPGRPSARCRPRLCGVSCRDARCRPRPGRMAPRRGPSARCRPRHCGASCRDVDPVSQTPPQA